MSAIGILCHTGQQSLVKVGLGIEWTPVLIVIQHVAAAAHTYGVQPDAIFACKFGCGLRVDRTSVVHSVGQQDDDFADCFALFDAVDGGGKAVAYGGAVFKQACPHSRQLAVQHIVVDGQRSLSECFAGKLDKGYAVALASFYEFECHVFGGLKAVRFEVLAFHTARHVHCQHNVDTLYLHLLAAQLALRASQRHNEQSHSYAAQHEAQMVQSVPECLAAFAEHIGRSYVHRGFDALVAQNVPDYHCRHQRQQKQQPRMSKTNIVEHYFPSSFSALFNLCVSATLRTKSVANCIAWSCS